MAEQINKKNFKPSEDRMKQVANLLGVELEEEFQIQFFGHSKPFKNTIYRLTIDGLQYRCSKSANWSHTNALQGLLVGKHQIVKFE